MHCFTIDLTILFVVLEELLLVLGPIVTIMRTYKHKTVRTSVKEDQLRNAVHAVEIEGKSIRAAAQMFGTNRTTLRRYMATQQMGYEKTAATHRVFTNEQEILLADHIKLLADCFHGLDRDKCMKLALDYATANDIHTPEN